jgi:hypothetical protein
MLSPIWGITTSVICIPLYLAFKYAAEMRGQALRNRGPGSAASQLRHGSDRLREAARNNVLEIAQVGRDVQGETVRCDPSADVHADGGDFALAHPDARQFRNAARLDAKIRQSIHQHLLDGAHVGTHVALPFAQVQDRIADDLSRPVIGHIAAAVRGMEGDAGAGQEFLARQKVFHVTIAAHGDGVGMLQQDELVGDDAGLALPHELLLQFKCATVFHTAR